MLRSQEVVVKYILDTAGKQAQGDMTTLEDISVLAKLRAHEEE